MEPLVSTQERGLEGTSIFDAADEGGTLVALIYFPRKVWEGAEDEYEQLELINAWTYPDFLIADASWKDVTDTAPNVFGDEIVIEASIEFDLD